MSAIKIVVLHRGFVFIGPVSYRDGKNVMESGYNIRLWGTTRGLYELQSGPTESVKLDPVMFPIEWSDVQEVFRLVVDESSWSARFSELR
mgnify:CR=1 FL=1